MVTIRLKELAEKWGKTISDIARETGINRNTVTSLFHEKVDGIKFSTLEKICDVYNIEIADLIVHKSKEEQDDDGVYKQEGEAPLFTAWPPISVFNNLDARYFDFGFGGFHCYFEKGYLKGYFRKKQMNRLAKYVFTKFSDEKELAELYNAYLLEAKKVQDLYFKYCSDDLLYLSENELRDFFGILRKRCERFWKMSLFIDSFDAGFDQNQIKEAGEQYDMTMNELSILTNPDEMTFNNERILDLIKIVKDIKLKRIKNDQLDDFIADSARIAAYRKKYDYYKSNYLHIEHITDEEIKNEITKYRNDSDLLKKTYDELNNYEEIQKTKKVKILKKYKLKSNPLAFFARLTYWREHRKQTNLMSIHLMFYVLATVERLTGISVEHLKNAHFDELDNILKGLIGHDALARRESGGIMVVLSEEGNKIIEGKEAESLKEEQERLLLEGKEDKVIKGFVASQGYAKGIAKVVLDKNSFEKFEEGDILVTGMTRPEFVPLMKKAAGIVTNEGGITCHAAIVSRELSKPCIIGTQNATQEIEDGDLIEVRANHGTVRILEKAKLGS